MSDIKVWNHEGIEEKQLLTNCWFLCFFTLVKMVECLKKVCWFFCGLTSKQNMSDDDVFSFYLIAELPQAPCLSVRMLTIFWMSCVAVTWSRYLAARIRWSHIFSSSRFSAAYWAQLDCGEQKGKRRITHSASRKESQNKCVKRTDLKEDRL